MVRCAWKMHRPTTSTATTMVALLWWWLLFLSLVLSTMEAAAAATTTTKVEKGDHPQRPTPKMENQKDGSSTTTKKSARTSTSTPASPPTPPNFIVLFMDDLGYGDLGFTGHPTTKTPNLDYLAWNGKILTTWYSGCHICTGSRAALLTGRQFPRTGLPGVLNPIESIGLPLNETTLAEQLKQYDRNYTTAIVGKWHLGQRPIYLPGNRGFDYYLGIPYSDDMGDGITSQCPVTTSTTTTETGTTTTTAATTIDTDSLLSMRTRNLQENELLKKKNHFHQDVANNNGKSKESSPSSTTTAKTTNSWGQEWYDAKGFLNANYYNNSDNNNNNNNKLSTKPHDKDPASKYLPLVYQEFNQTYILEQPLDFTTLAQKYNNFIMKFLERQTTTATSNNNNKKKNNDGDDNSDNNNTNNNNPFLLYVPFSHVHCTSATQPEMQYAGCDFQNSTLRGRFGDALAEADWIVGNIINKLRQLNLEESTLILFTSDNGPWMARGLSAGSEGLFTGRYAATTTGTDDDDNNDNNNDDTKHPYTNTGKGSTWEGGIRMPAFAYWKGTIQPHSRSAEIVSSLDVFPTLSALAGIPLPSNRTFDGRDMSDILLSKGSDDTAAGGGGKSKHEFLFFYNTCSGDPYWSVSSVRHGKYKAHWCTAPGIGSNKSDHDVMTKRYDPPLLFNIEKDPSESTPIANANTMPTDPEDRNAMERILKAYAMEKATFEFGTMVPYPDGPNEGPDRYGLCCDRSLDCYCIHNNSSSNSNSNNYYHYQNHVGIFNLGTKEHHDKYHKFLGEEEPSPPRTRAQAILQGL